MGFIFFYTTILTARENTIRQYNSMRTIRVVPAASLSQELKSSLVLKLRKNSAAAIDDIEMNFILNSEVKKDKPRSFIAYLHPEEHSGRIIGRGITQEEIEKQAFVLVSGNASMPPDTPDEEKNAEKKYYAGDTVSFDGMDFAVIGSFHEYPATEEIPYTVGLNHFCLKELDIMVPAETSDNQKKALGGYVQGLMPGSRVTLPKPINQKLLINMFIPLAAGLLIGLSAMINFLFVFKYMLESSRKDYFVFRICGSSSRKLSAVLFSELIFLFTVSYAAGALIFAGFRRAFKTNFIFAGSEFHFSQVALIYLISVLLIVLIMIPYLLKYRRQAVNGGGTV